ncbi:glycosyl hydrolase family protein [Methanophagales archaeon]|nr:MAG: glycosyl hydrolase family protein [Methanophagales archaeon]
MENKKGVRIGIATVVIAIAMLTMVPGASAAFSDDFTAPDGPNVNETKWLGCCLNDPDITWGGYIENNRLKIGPGEAEMDYDVLSNPTFKYDTDSPLIIEFDAKTAQGYYKVGLHDTYHKGIYFEKQNGSDDIRARVSLNHSTGWNYYVGPWLGINPQEWHTYKIKWTESHIYWYVDGNPVDDLALTWDTSLPVGFARGRRIGADSEIWIDNVSVYGGKMFDTTPPGCSIVINEGAEYTDSQTVTLTLYAEDPESGVTEMRFANDNTQTESWTDWEPYATTKTWILSEGYGEKKVYVRYKNGAGLESLAYFDTIRLGPVTEPSVIDYDCWTDWCCEQYPSSWCCDLGWSNVDNALVRDGTCAVAASDDFAYITLDMGETKNSGTITVRSAVVDYEPEPRWGNTIVYGSADNSNWVTLGTFDTPEVNLADRTVSFSNQQVRYVKVYLPITECGVWWDIDSITW